MPPKFDPTEVKLGKWSELCEKLNLKKNEIFHSVWPKYNLFMQKSTTINWDLVMLLFFACIKSNEFLFRFSWWRLVYLRCVGGEVGATSSLAPKIGPLGLVSVNINFLMPKLYWMWQAHVLRFVWMCVCLRSEKIRFVVRVDKMNWKSKWN